MQPNPLLNIVTSSPFSNPQETGRFARLLRAAFDHRRKTLRIGLGYVLDEPARQRVLKSVDGQRRPESLSVDEWLALFRVADAE